jgi:predicted DNA-binding protein
MEKQLVVRIDPELKDKVSALARAEGKTSSQLIRDLLEEYVRKRDMSAYIDSLWSRIGEQLQETGVEAGDVDEAIRQVRSK